MFIDLHCDTISVLHAHPEVGSLRKNSLQVDLEKLRQGGAIAQFFALYIDMYATESPRDACLELAALFRRELFDNSSEIALARTIEDVHICAQQGKIAAFLTIEEGGALEGELTNLQMFYDLGVRLITLTWNYPNEIGFPACFDQDKGLTCFGAEVIAEMNRLKMLIDVSHLSDQGFFDVLRLSAAPVLASHSNSRAVTNHSRNLTDDMIRALAEQGGIMGLNFSGDFLGGGRDSRVEDMIRHVRHILRVGGSDVLALGSDFDGVSSKLEIVDCGKMEILIHAMRKNGIPLETIDKICVLNCMRILKECL